MHRRDFLVGATASLAAFPAFADVPKSFRPSVWPPLQERSAFIAWMEANRGEDPIHLGRRFERYQELLSFQDLWTRADKRAFLLTPREEFVRPIDREQAYVGHYLDIGFGVSITPPGTMGRMTSEAPLSDLRSYSCDLMRSADPPDGIISISGSSSIALVAGIEAAGKRLGHDVDMVSKQSAEFLNWIRPEIHTVNESVRLAGRELAKAVIARIDGVAPELLQSVSSPVWSSMAPKD